MNIQHSKFVHLNRKGQRWRCFVNTLVTWLSKSIGMSWMTFSWTFFFHQVVHLYMFCSYMKDWIVDNINDKPIATIYWDWFGVRDAKVMQKVYNPLDFTCCICYCLVFWFLRLLWYYLLFLSLQINKWGSKIQT